MSDFIAQMKAMADQAAATGVDMTVATKGGGGARLLPAGYAYARLVEYIELGMQPQEFNGKAKAPMMEVQLGFALYNTADRQYANDDGTPYIIRPYRFALGTNEKSKAFRWFSIMNWRGQSKHFAQLICDPFLVKIVHEAKSRTDATIVSRIDLDGTLAPVDAASGAPYPIPEARQEDCRMFLWDSPTKAAWDSLFIEGTFDDGKSKNMLQELCMSATNFDGSPLQQMLMGGVPALPTTPAAPTVTAPAVPQVNPPVAPSPNVGIAGVPSTSASPVGTTSTAAPASASVPPVSMPTFPSSPAMPAMPSIPVVPALPQ